MAKITKVISLVLLAGCGSLEQSETEKIHRQNATGEYILRNHDEQLYTVPPPKQRPRDKYPWED